MAASSISPSLHPATRIVGWLVFAVLVQRFSMVLLAVASLTLFTLLWLGAWPFYVRMLRRTRWLLLSLVLIYGWATPGAAMFSFTLSPTLEGLQSGALQAWRLGLLLAALALLLAGAAKQELLAGLYRLMQPFQRCGFSAQRVAARLWLTLHYAETMPASGTLAQRLQAAFAPAGVQAVQVVIEQQPFTWRDAAAGGLLALSTVLLML